MNASGSEDRETLAHPSDPDDLKLNRLPAAREDDDLGDDGSEELLPIGMRGCRVAPKHLRIRRELHEFVSVGCTEGPLGQCGGRGDVSLEPFLFCENLLPLYPQVVPHPRIVRIS